MFLGGSKGNIGKKWVNILSTESILKPIFIFTSVQMKPKIEVLNFHVPYFSEKL